MAQELAPCACGLPVSQYSLCIAAERRARNTYTVAVNDATASYISALRSLGVEYDAIFRMLVEDFGRVVINGMNASARELATATRTLTQTASNRRRPRDVNINDHLSRPKAAQLEAIFRGYGNQIDTAGQLGVASNLARNVGLGIATAATLSAISTFIIANTAVYTASGLLVLFGSGGAATTILGFVGTTAPSVLLGITNITAATIGAGIAALPALFFAPLLLIATFFDITTRTGDWVAPEDVDNYNLLADRAYDRMIAAARGFGRNLTTAISTFENSYIAAVNRIPTTAPDGREITTVIDEARMARDDRFREINEQYCGTDDAGCTQAEILTCRQRSTSQVEFRHQWNAQTRECECNAFRRVQGECTEAQTTACVTRQIAGEDVVLNDSCECVARTTGPTGCTGGQVTGCAAQNNAWTRATLDDTCRCNTTQIACSPTNIQALRDASERTLESWTWNAATSTCEGTYATVDEPPPGNCSAGEVRDCYNSASPWIQATPEWDNTAQICRCNQTQIQCSPEEHLAFARRANPAPNTLYFGRWDAAAGECVEASRTVGTTTGSNCPQVREACATADRLRARNPNTGNAGRWTVRVLSDGNCVCDPSDAEAPCASTRCTNGCPNALANCRCDTVDCSSQECPQGQRGVAVADANGNLCNCGCEDIPCPSGTVRNTATGGCESPPDSCCGGGGSFITNSILRGDFYGTDGTLTTILNACERIFGLPPGYVLDPETCCCRWICTSGRNPVWSVAEQRCISGETTGDCPPGTSLNADGNCVAPPPPPPPPEIPIIPPVVVQPVEPVAPPTPVPPCAKHRSSTSWRCITASSAGGGSAGTGVAACNKPLTRITPRDLLTEAACLALETPNLPNGSRLSAEIWLDRND